MVVRAAGWPAAVGRRRGERLSVAAGQCHRADRAGRRDGSRSEYTCMLCSSCDRQQRDGRLPKHEPQCGTQPTPSASSARRRSTPPSRSFPMTHVGAARDANPYRPRLVGFNDTIGSVARSRPAARPGGGSLERVGRRVLGSRRRRDCGQHNMSGAEAKPEQATRRAKIPPSLDPLDPLTQT